MPSGAQLARTLFDRDLRARGFGAVVDQVEPRRRVSTPDLPLLAAGADEAVADDVTHPDGQVEIVSGDAHREDSAAMEHVRQSRLRRWQALGS